MFVAGLALRFVPHLRCLKLLAQLVTFSALRVDLPFSHIACSVRAIGFTPVRRANVFTYPVDNLFH